jgi:bifunctional non-homologous end joining protein LigD
MLPRLSPMRLSRRPEPFDSEEFLYELKIDGFRALAQIADGKAELISRNGNVFRGFAELATWIAEHLQVENAVLDGEIAFLTQKADSFSGICYSGDPIACSWPQAEAELDSEHAD